jgi:hypothetical protein
MAAVLPTQTRTIDDDWTNTWYEIRAEVIDNVTNATILWMALKEHGCFKPQTGGEYIERSIGYGEKSTQRFSKGKVLDQSVVPLDTAGLWNWRNFLVDVNRTLLDDVKNAGKFKIKSYLGRRMEAARTALVQDSETYSMQWGGYYDGDPQFNGIYDICPNATAESAVGDGSASDSQSSGTSNGGLDRSNNWWKNWVGYDDASEDKDTYIAGPTNEPFNLNLVPDMRHMFNSITDNMESPNFILTSQNIYEAYEDEASDKRQIVESGFTRKAVDLGFDAFTYKGATMSWTRKQTSNHIHMLNLNHVEFVYNPLAWFDMTEWKSTANQLERVAYIVCVCSGLITNQPRRHGVMEYAS